jgi:hypothetical protein
MLVDRLNSNGHKAIYVQPVYLLLDLIHLKEKFEELFSPRRASVSANKEPPVLQRMLIGSPGYLYALVSCILMKIVSRGKIIVCDRYFYQFFFDLFGDMSENIVRIFPKADITFLLDGDLEIFYSRMENSFDASVNTDYYVDALNLCRLISRKYGFIQIEANLERRKINDMIISKIREMIGTKYDD